MNPLTDRTLVDLLEEVVAFVIDEDEGGEVFDFDFPDGFHAEFGEVEDFLGDDVLFGEEGGGSPCGAEVEAAVFLAGVGDHLGAVAFGEHDHGGTVGLEEVNIGIHASSGGGAEGAGGHALWCLGGAGVVDGVVFEVGGDVAVFFEDFFDFGMSDVAGDDDGAAEGDGGGDGIF